MEEKKNEIILFENQGVKLEVNLKDETVWLNRQQLSELFDRDIKTIGKHINNALKEELLEDNSVVSKFATTASDGKTYQVEYYNLDMILSVGYRVKSNKGIVFRRWANKVLRDYMESEIKKEIEDVMIYGDFENRLPNTSSIAFKDVDANQLMLLLESFEIFVSTGSACNSEIAEDSHVLVACGANLGQYSPIRVSLSKFNTKEEIDIFVKHLIQCVSMIRRRK